MLAKEWYIKLSEPCLWLLHQFNTRFRIMHSSHLLYDILLHEYHSQLRLTQSVYFYFTIRQMRRIGHLDLGNPPNAVNRPS